MPKKFIVSYNGINVNEDDIDEVCELFNDYARIDNFSANLYDWKIFIKKARDYVCQKPPNIIECGEMLWEAAIYSLKKFYSQVKVGLNPEKAIAFAVILLMNISDNKTKNFLNSGWRAAEAGHNNFYNLSLSFSEAKELIDSVNLFCLSVDSLKPKKFTQFIEEVTGIKTEPSPVTTTCDNLQNLIKNFDYLQI